MPFERHEDGQGYLAVIDIGSNSVRLVVFSGRTRVPSPIFNEKLMCGLGAEVGKTGKMGAEAIEMAISTLKRFSALCDQMQVRETLIVATAAVRDAKNGAKFVQRVRDETGFEIAVIDGGEEGRLSALGVLSGEPDALGLVGDLGGGSLELARVKGGEVTKTLSLPLGPLRLISKFGNKHRAIREYLREQFAAIDWLAETRGQNLYMVGGSWRNIAKLMMREKSSPLPILHGYANQRSELVSYCRRLSHLEPSNIPFGGSLPYRRLQVLPVAAIILQELLVAIQAKKGVLSSYGLREGLIFDKLSIEDRREDPFLHICRVLAEERCRFAEHASVIYDWSSPLFKRPAQNSLKRQQLHMAICLLGDIAWPRHAMSPSRQIAI